MIILRLLLLISLMALTAMGQTSSDADLQRPASCPVTTPPAVTFKPPPGYELGNRSFWIGTEKLFTAIRTSGEVWGWGPRAPGHENDVQPLTAKTFWASVNFNYRNEYPPNIKVTGKRLDGDAPPLLTMRPTNAFPGPTAAMLVGVYVPTPGCWEITAEYRGEKLSYIVWVRPAR